MKRKLFDILNLLGIPCYLTGRRYLERGVEILLEDPLRLYAITKILYPELAKEFGTTPGGVERAMRHAIEVGYLRGNSKVWYKLFGETLSSSSGKPTNAEFLAQLACGIEVIDPKELLELVCPF